MFKSYLMFADRQLKKKQEIMSVKKEDAINDLYSEGVAMAMVFHEDVYLCVTDVDKYENTIIYQITRDGGISEVKLAS
jgi:hypothetical protein